MNLNEKKIRTGSLVVPLLFLCVAGVGPSALAQSAGTFTVTGNMITARSQHTATLLADGRVLLTGGAVQGQVLASAELYDPSTGTFTATGKMTVPRADHTATLLADRRVLIADGRSAELYDPDTGIFTATGTTTAPHGCSAVLIAGGKVLIAGDPAPFGSASADLYSPDTGTFSLTGAYASIEIAQLDRTLFPHYGGSDCPHATALADGRVLIAGGAFAELYDPRTDTFSMTGTKITTGGFVKTVPDGWSDPSKATLLLNGMVLFSGGDGDLGPAYSAWLYNPSVGTFTGTGSMSTPRVRETATLLPDGTVLVAGSFAVGQFPNPDPRALRNAELYDPSIGTFKAAPDLTTSRFSHTATLLNDGRVLIAGGTSETYPFYKYLASAELYTSAVLIRAPVLFSLLGDGRGQGAIWHAASGEIASPSSPAVAGEPLSMYTTSLADGGVVPPRVAIGGRLAEVLYFGPAPGYPGYNQVNFRMPSGVSSGAAVPVRLSYLGRASNQVTLSVQ